MRVVCIFRDNQDYSRSVNEWLENFHRQTGREIEVMDPDTNAGFCEAYNTAKEMTDETKRAEALLFVVEAIDKM